MVRGRQASIFSRSVSFSLDMTPPLAPNDVTAPKDPNGPLPPCSPDRGAESPANRGDDVRNLTPDRLPVHKPEDSTRNTRLMPLAGALRRGRMAPVDVHTPPGGDHAGNGPISRRSFLETSAATTAVALVARQRPGRTRVRPALRQDQRGLRRVRDPGPAAAHGRAEARRREDHRGLRPQPQERRLHRVVGDRAGGQGPRLPRRPLVGQGGPGRARRPRGRPGGRGPSLRRLVRRRLQHLRGLPGDAGEGEGPRRGLHHDPRPPPRDRGPGRHEGGQARHRPQAAGERPAGGPPGVRGRPGDGPRDPHVLRGGEPGGAAAVGVDLERRHRPGPRGPQLVLAPLLAPGDDEPARRRRRSPRASTGTSGSARCPTGPTAPTSPTPSSGAGTTSGPAPSGTWGTTPSTRSSRS